MTFEPHPREFFAARSAGDLSQARPSRIANLRDKLAIAGQRRHRPRHRRTFQRPFRRHCRRRISSKKCWSRLARQMADGRRRLLLRRQPRRQCRHADRGRQAIRLPGRDPAHRDEWRHAHLLVGRAQPRWPPATSRMPRQLLGHPYFDFRPCDPRPEARPHARLPDAEPARARTGARPCPASSWCRCMAWRRSRCPAWPASACARRSTTAAACCWKRICSTIDQHCYGKLVRVEFLKKLRDEEKYVDLPTLTAAIARDADDARALFRDTARRAHRDRPNLKLHPAASACANRVIASIK